MVWLAVAALAVIVLYLWWRPRRAPAVGEFAAEMRIGANAAKSALTSGLDTNMLDAEATSLRIEGMTCTRCADSVQRALQRAPGVVDAKVGLETGVASVTYHPRVITIDQMMAPLRELGFVPAPTTRDEPAGQFKNSAIAVPAGCARTSFQVNHLYEGHQLAEARKTLSALPGVREAGAHRRSNGEKGAIVWAIFDPEYVTSERIATAVHGMGYSVAEAEEDASWAPITVS